MRKRAAEESMEAKPKRSRYACKFLEKWTHEFLYLTKSQKGQGYAYCKLCSVDFSVSVGGRSDVTRHALENGPSHVKRGHVKTRSRRPDVSQTARSKFNPQRFDPVKRAELLIANFAAEHNISPDAAASLGALLKQMFPDSEIAEKMQLRVYPERKCTSDNK